jgi:uncharacterized protein YijF (DUF1287 family)
MKRAFTDGGLGARLLLLGALGSAAGVQAEPTPLGDAPASLFVDRVVDAAVAQTRQAVVYDGSYRRIAYPGGDVPPDVGVCTDVVVRAFRAAGIDLQVLVHEDMTRAFDAYPQLWGHARPDPNIDHRRVPNLRTFLARREAQLPIAMAPDAYEAGDLVTWRLPSGLPHIGIVTRERSEDGERPLIVHNIGRGPRLEDMLFAFPITGHYRFHGAQEEDR